MIRENLFKGKRKANGQWIHGDLLLRHNVVGKPLDCYIKPLYDDTEYLVDLDTIGRYVGISDKNNIKIFEHDIVKTKYGRLCKVVWLSSPCHQGWDLIGIEDEHPAPGVHDLWYREHLEVVGNVYDNQELLEEREK